jgi:DNA-binding response OmpR family regulator
MAKQPKPKLESPGKIRLSPTLLLLSDDQALEDLVTGVVEHPWKLIRQGAGEYRAKKMFAQTNVRLVLLDDEAVDENDRGRLLAQIRKHFSGTLLYVAGSQSDGNEKRARTNGAQYYISKPLPLERFGYVLRAFLRIEQVRR